MKLSKEKIYQQYDKKNESERQDNDNPPVHKYLVKPQS